MTEAKSLEEALHIIVVRMGTVLQLLVQISIIEVDISDSGFVIYFPRVIEAK